MVKAKNYIMIGGGKCSLCGSPGTNRTSCPWNPKAKNKNAVKHPRAKGPAPGTAVPAPAVAKPTYNDKYGPHDLYDIGERLRLGILTKAQAQKMADDAWYKTLSFEGVKFQDRPFPFDDYDEEELYRETGMHQSTDFLWYYDVKDRDLMVEPYDFRDENDVDYPSIPKDSPKDGKYYLHVFSK